MMLQRLLLISLVTFLLSACSAPVVIGAAAAGGAVVATDNRTAGTVIDDQTIKLKAAERLEDDEGLKETAHINVTSYNGIVLLTGEAISEGLKKNAESLVSDIPKVRKVVNEVVITEPTSLQSRSHDTWLTTKVKSSLLTTDEIPGNQIKVVTENGTVFMMGLVTRKQGSDAAEIARTTTGVRRVVKIFEYTD